MSDLTLDEALALDASGTIRPEAKIALSPLRRDFLHMARAISEDGAVEALALSEEILDRSRSPGERDPEVEARVRLDRALIGAVEDARVGFELRWATDRMATLRPGSPGHALALLNLASWHASVGETMMALAVHSDISSASDHPNDLVALSRLEVGRLHQKIGDAPSSLRHLWSSASRFSEEGMKGEEAIALLEWLDLALDCLAEDAERMGDVVANTMPRTNMEPSEAKAHPEDVLDSATRAADIILEDPTGQSRPDIGLLVDAAHCISSSVIAERLREKIGSIQDQQVVGWIQELDLSDSEPDQS